MVLKKVAKEDIIVGGEKDRVMCKLLVIDRVRLFTHIDAFVQTLTPQKHEHFTRAIGHKTKIDFLKLALIMAFLKKLLNTLLMSLTMFQNDFKKFSHETVCQRSCLCPSQLRLCRSLPRKGLPENPFVPKIQGSSPESLVRMSYPPFFV